jgi:hypothetical protein
MDTNQNQSALRAKEVDGVRGLLVDLRKVLAPKSQQNLRTTNKTSQTENSKILKLQITILITAGQKLRITLKNL